MGDSKLKEKRGGRRLSPTPTNIHELTSQSSVALPLADDPHHNATRIPGIEPQEAYMTQTPSAAMPPYPPALRWAILGSASFILMGNYYAFDNIAALNRPLKEYLQLSDLQYDYVLNLLYTVYSIPNVILPWIGGYAINKFGNRRLIISLSILVAFGHLVVCLGLEKKHVPVMIIGRVIFGAAESLTVAQCAITVKYFRGKELALALGINLCVSRLGSVLNDVLTPFIWSRSNSVPAAFWGGFVSCVLSLIMAFLLVWLDWRFGSHSDAESLPPLDRTRPSSCLIDARLSFEGVGQVPATMIMTDASLKVPSAASSAQPPPVVVSAPPTIREIAMETMNGYDEQQHEHRPQYHANDSECTLIEEKEPWLKRGIRAIKALVDYSVSFWILCAMTFVVVGIAVPFNSIHAGFLQMRWYHGDPVKAAQVMTVPDLLSALLVLPVGYFVDHFGQKSWLFMLCGLIIGFSHAVLGLLQISTPIPCLIALGVSSSITAIFGSAVPALVRAEQLATAYGIMASSYNSAFVVFPMIVAKLMTVDPTVYTFVEIFFSSLGFLGFLLALWLKLLNRHGDLDKREIDNRPPPSPSTLGGMR
ncbi:hypothetical protein KVV02_007257 [Mortierella alpina]|uniref:Lysosomal dipeptide transporter MFSD1 n=1 Tax=Mortierella alpina TaxID=64518 RepID=A0A9P8A636_MORAP|nr:hypothetical protein KVV02_007257 [Mortierella alpina]